MDDDKSIDGKQFSLFDAGEDAACKISPAVESATRPHQGVRPVHSNYVVYVDESGDHGLLSIDPQYPVFVLAFCVFHKRHYSETVIPAIHSFKFKHFGHDHIVLHENEIRKEQGAFNIFRSKHQKQDFIQELAGIVETSNFILISCVIDKVALAKKGGVPPNPYHLALGFCLETLDELLVEKSQQDVKTHVVVERRGEKEDNDLELEFRRICDGSNKKGKVMTLPGKSDPDRVKALLHRWYLDHARQVFIEVMNEWLLRLKGYQRPRLTVRSMQSRWGSLSQAGTMTLNANLVRAPRACIEYVVAHELCHLKHRDHDTSFFRLLGQVMPDWEKRKQRLETALL